MPTPSGPLSTRPVTGQPNRCARSDNTHSLSPLAGSLWNDVSCVCVWLHSRLHRRLTRRIWDWERMYILSIHKWRYIYRIRSVMVSDFISHSITDVSSEPVIRYCVFGGTVRHVTDPLWPAKLNSYFMRFMASVDRDKECEFGNIYIYIYRKSGIFSGGWTQVDEVFRNYVLVYSDEFQ